MIAETRSASRGETMTGKDVHLQEVLFEFRPVGRFVRVAAIDPITGIEVTMVGDATYGEEMLKRIAVRKLKYVIAKRQRQKD